VRSAILKVIQLHTQYDANKQLPEHNWSHCQLDLRGADLSRVQLEKSVLFDPILDDCTIVDSVLIGIQLTHAHMRRADLSGAMLTYAFLRRCDLTDAVINERTDLTGISYDAATVWPCTVKPPPSRIHVASEPAAQGIESMKAGRLREPR
jgi:uncharacterized protein YjbI with pentapeptide repeats